MEANEQEMMVEGLREVNYTERKITRAAEETNKERFRHHFGADPAIVCAIEYDLQHSQHEDSFIAPADFKRKHLFIALHTLRKYPTEIEREPIFDISPHYGRDVSWNYIRKIRGLKHQKIRFPDAFPEGSVWIMSVDGVHAKCQEMRIPEFSQDMGQYSHKSNSAGWGYEIGLSLTESSVIWMKGPNKCGDNDLRVFTKEGGLKEKLLSVNKKAIGDNGYQGHHEAISAPNAFDGRPVRKFKTRAMNRTEKFNGMLKIFESLNGTFRSDDKEKFASVFEAVVVVCQYKMEMGQPLFDILVEDIMTEADDSSDDDSTAA